MKKLSIHNNKAFGNKNINYIFTPIQKVILKHFANLANDIGDNLFTLEVLYNNLSNVIKTSPPQRNNFDVLAEEIDKILNVAKIKINQDCYKHVVKFAKYT